jgi:hypothetical protein
MCPGDPLQFILDKLRALKENGIDELNWYLKPLKCKTVVQL